MALYFKDTEITNIDNLVPQTGLDITDMWFGTTNVFTVWAVYEGTLPATLNANGDDMRQYQIYGNTGGVGGVTKNEFNVDWIDGEYIGSDLKNIQLSVKPNTAYTMKSNCPRYNNAALVFIDYKKSSSTTSDNGVWNGQTRTITSTDNGTLYVRYRNNNTGYDLTSYLYMLTEGTTPPVNYVPYGYEVDISTSDGTNATTTPIYIGNEPLEKDEYVDYQAGKIYRVNPNNLFDGSILNGYYTNADFDLSTSQSSLRDFQSFKLFLPAGTYSLCFNKPTFIARRIINGVMNMTHPIISHLVFTCESDSYVGFSYRLYNDIPDDNPDIYFVVIAGAKYEFLKPTEPPVPLPALPTCQGTTIVDYAVESQATPEKVLLKYRKENF